MNKDKTKASPSPQESVMVTMEPGKIVDARTLKASDHVKAVGSCTFSHHCSHRMPWSHHRTGTDHPCGSYPEYLNHRGPSGCGAQYDPASAL